MKVNKVLASIALVAASISTAQAGYVFAWSHEVEGLSQALRLSGDFGTVQVEAADMGWWDSTGNHAAANKNYITNRCLASEFCFDDRDRNNYFLFDLSGLGGSITSAELILANPSNGYYSGVAPELAFNVYDVVTPLDQLSADGFDRKDIFNDLGSGALYGTRIVNNSANGGYVTVELNPYALNVIQGSLGGQFAVGGAVAAVPEPEVYAMLGMGAAMLALARRRRNKV